MSLRTRTHGLKETITDLHALDGLNTHHRTGKSSIKTTIRFNIRAHACGNAVHHNLDHTAQRIGVLLRLINTGNHPLFRILVKSAHRRSVQRLKILRLGKRGLLRIGNTCATNGKHMRNGTNTERLLQELLGNLTQRHTRSRLTRGRTLQHRTSIIKTILTHASQIRMPRTRARQRGIAALTSKLMIKRIRTHHLSPLRPLGVGDLNGHRRTNRLTKTHTSQHTNLVLLELHTRATTIPKTTTRQRANNILRGDMNARGQSFNHGDKRLTMRLACCLPTQHANSFSHECN